MKFLEARQLVDRAAQHPAYPLRVALSGTLAPLDLYLRAHLARHGWHAALDTLPFGTLQQWLRTGEADPARDLLVLLPWDLLPALDWRTGLPADPLDEATIAAALDDARQLLAPLAAQGVPLFYLAAPVPPVADTPRAQQWLEAQLHALLLGVGATRLPPEAFSLTSYLAHGAPVAAAACSAVAAQLVHASLGRGATPGDAAPRKLLVTDLDGVMWRGVVGEDGPAGVRCAADGAGYPHFVYQTLLRRLRGQGVLLAVASRNDEDLARAPFRLAGSVLREEDFVAVCAGYGAKSARIRDLAGQLALGLDAVVFVDDNPVELAEVAGALPAVRTVPFPDTVDALPAFLQALRDLFPVTGRTHEDRHRTALYRQRLASAAPASGDPDALPRFLHALEMRLVVSERDPGQAGGRERAVQLINKTNQFTLNGRRRTAEEVDRVLAQGGRLFVATLEDRHGSHGEVLACVVEPGGRVTSLVMSCRVLQRGVECAFAGWLGAQLAPGLPAGAPLRLVYRATGRNAPVGAFLQQLGVSAERRDAEPLDGVEAEAEVEVAITPAQLEAAGRTQAPWVRIEEEPMTSAHTSAHTSAIPGTPPRVAVGA
jgi:FkbH-like protein